MAHYELTREEIADLDRPVKGLGGFEGLMRRLQKQVNHATGEIKLSDDDLAEIQRYAFDYKQVGSKTDSYSFSAGCLVRSLVVKSEHRTASDKDRVG